MVFVAFVACAALCHVFDVCSCLCCLNLDTEEKFHFSFHGSVFACCFQQRHIWENHPSPSPCSLSSQTPGGRIHRWGCSILEIFWDILNQQPRHSVSSSCAEADCVRDI